MKEEEIGLTLDRDRLQGEIETIVATIEVETTEVDNLRMNVFVKCNKIIDSRRGPGRDSGRDRDSSRGGGYKIIIKNLPWSVTWQNLKDAFREFGNVVRAEVPQDDKVGGFSHSIVLW